MTGQGDSPSPPTPLPEGEGSTTPSPGSTTPSLGSKTPSPTGRGHGEGIPRVEFEIFTPTSEKEVGSGTVSRARATCLCCGAVLHPERVRAQLAAQRGGADVVFGPSPLTPLPEGEGSTTPSPGSKTPSPGSKTPSPTGRGQGDGIPNRIGGARLLAVVTLWPGEQGRHYRLPTERDYQAVWKAQQRLEEILAEWERAGRKSLCPVPDEPLPPIGTLGFRVQRYGMMQWGDLFTVRQKVGMATLAQIVQSEPRPQGSGEISSTLAEVLGLALSRAANAGSALCRWNLTGENHEGIYSRQALPIVWNFSEVNFLSEATGSVHGALEWILNVIEAWRSPLPGGRGSNNAQAQLANASVHPLPNESASVWFTDPPYYDAIPYSDLSDFFFVWLKRTLLGHPLLRDPFDPANPLSPKLQEAVQDETKKVNGQPKNRAWFEDTMAKAFAEGRRVLKEDGIGSVVFAHKTTEGWEALLGGLIRGGWTITGSWPIATEMSSRLRARDSAALATSVHLVCRPRPEDAPVGDWGEVLRELPRRVAEWMERLQSEGIRGADLVFACIGPALEIYSRYSKVVDAEEREIPLGGDPEARDPHKRGYLAYVWEVVGRVVLKQILGTDAPNVYGEDVRLTALFLWTLRATNGSNGANGAKKAAAQVDEDAELEADDADAEDDEGASRKPTRGGYSLPYDIVRRFCQPLGIHIERWNGHLINIHKGVVTLLPIDSRAKRLLGADVAKDLKQVAKPESNQPTLFDDSDEEIKERKRRKEAARRRFNQATWADLHQDTVPLLDHVHKAMLFQKQGQTNALRELLLFEKTYRPDFLRLANALSALYPAGSEEKRLLDAMLLAVPR